MRMPDPLERPVVAGERPRSSPTRDDQDVEGRRGLPGVVGKDAEAFGARDGPAVTGKREGADAKSAYLHQGIAGRAFERNFQLAEHVEVKGARLENGLLHVDLERIVPEEKKPRRIVINAPELKTIEGAKAAA